MPCNCGNSNKENKTSVTSHRQSYNLLHVIKDEITGQAEYVDEQTKQDRIDKCNVCNNLVSLTRQCKKCGCFIDVKARYKKAFCPIGQW